MKVTFRIHYHTTWGENLCITGSPEALGNMDYSKAFPMNHVGNGEWEAIVHFEEESNFEYKYLVKSHDEAPQYEGGKYRKFASAAHDEVVIRDFWRPKADPESALFTKVFSEVLMPAPHLHKKHTHKASAQSISFRIRHARVPKGKSLAIVGNQTVLGNWKEPVLMTADLFPVWEKTIALKQVKFPVSYKYVLVDEQNGKISEWEDGPERNLFYVDHKANSIIHLQNDEKFRSGQSAWKGAGVAIPVFSLRTSEGFGIGEFNDLRKLVDWAVQSGLKMIQLLPINETVATHSWLDSYPYKAISVFALHPIYLNVDDLGEIENEKLRDEFALAREVLNAKPYVDYVEVARIKSKYYKIIFDQTWKKVKQSKTYKTFFEENRDWLEPYAAFCFLRDRYKTSDFREWGPWAVYQKDKVSQLVDPKAKNHEHIAIHYYLQFNLDQQLKAAVAYAHEQGVALKGDIPIGISPNSIEAWTAPELFNLNGQAGAPPDDFAVLGQNWGFPTYNWEVMAQDGFAWWKKRLSAMQKYFDAFRIDHILGFFRIWEIPQNAMHGLLGYFKPGLPLLPDEIQEQGIYFDKDRLTKPYIRGHFLHEFFGEHTDEVRKLYLTETSYNVFKLNKDYDTQKKIYQHFTPTAESGQQLSVKNVVIRDGLLALLDEVLFIKDPTVSFEAYHPRIAMHFSFTYRELDHETKNNLDRLYIDFFYQRHEQFWKNEAMKKLPALMDATNMLVCGEDLGMVPDTVPEVMQELNILSLEIQRMPKNPNIEFGHPAVAPYLSVCTTSTHDMSTIRGWWEENRDKTKRFYHHLLGHNDVPPVYAEPWVCREIINQHLYSPAMWTIFPIQDLLAMDGDLRWDETDKERINVPSDEKNQWKYRMILSMEELLKAEEFNKMLFELVKRSGRNND